MKLNIKILIAILLICGVVITLILLQTGIIENLDTGNDAGDDTGDDAGDDTGDDTAKKAAPMKNLQKALTARILKRLDYGQPLVEVARKMKAIEGMQPQINDMERRLGIMQSSEPALEYAKKTLISWSKEGKGARRLQKVTDVRSQSGKTKKTTPEKTTSEKTTPEKTEQNIDSLNTQINPTGTLATGTLATGTSAAPAAATPTITNCKQWQINNSCTNSTLLKSDLQNIPNPSQDNCCQPTCASAGWDQNKCRDQNVTQGNTGSIYWAKKNLDTITNPSRDACCNVRPIQRKVVRSFTIDCDYGEINCPTGKTRKSECGKFENPQLQKGEDFCKRQCCV